MASAASYSSPVEKILLAADPEDNSFECFGLELKLYEPSLIRRTFYKLSLQVHPDKSDHPQSKEAFQKLSNAFEILYDLESQTDHLEQIQHEQSKASKQAEKDAKDAARAAEHKAKKRKTKHDWKEERRKKKEQRNQQWAERNFDDVLKELRRREQLERDFRQRHSDARLEKRIQGMVWRAMKICRALDEQAGCPPTFVNGLWAPLYEQEVFREHMPLPEGWEWTWDKTVEEQQQLQQARQRVYTNVLTREHTYQHPKPAVEQLLNKAQKALDTNKFRFHTEPRLFLDETIQYLHEDHDYKDMDEDMKELEEEEQVRLAALGGKSPSDSAEYDF